MSLKTRWELYYPETGEKVTNLYVYPIRDFGKKRDALAIRDMWNHKYGTNLDVRKATGKKKR